MFARDEHGGNMVTERVAPVVTANPEQVSAWDGDEGEHWTDYEDEYNAVVHRLDGYLLDAAHILPGDRVLDIGCGCGLTTRLAAGRAPSGHGLGLDLSSRMIDRARERSRLEGPHNVAFEQADVQIHSFEGQVFDVAISRFGAMFFTDPVAAFTNIGSAMRSGGRLALLSWQGLRDNEWLTSIRGALAAGRNLPDPPAGAPGPFGLADPEAVRRILTAADFQDVIVEAVKEPLRLGTEAADAFGFVSGLGITRGLLNDLDDAARSSALETLGAVLAAHQTAEGVLLDSSSWLVTAHRP